MPITNPFKPRAAAGSSWNTTIERPDKFYAGSQGALFGNTGAAVVPITKPVDKAAVTPANTGPDWSAVSSAIGQSKITNPYGTGWAPSQLTSTVDQLKQWYGGLDADTQAKMNPNLVSTTQGLASAGLYGTPSSYLNTLEGRLHYGSMTPEAAAAESKAQMDAGAKAVQDSIAIQQAAYLQHYNSPEQVAYREAEAARKAADEQKATQRRSAYDTLSQNSDLSSLLGQFDPNTDYSGLTGENALSGSDISTVQKMLNAYSNNYPQSLLRNQAYQGIVQGLSDPEKRSQLLSAMQYYLDNPSLMPNAANRYGSGYSAEQARAETNAGRLVSMLSAPSYGYAGSPENQALWNQAVQWANTKSPWRSSAGQEIGGAKSYAAQYGSWLPAQVKYAELGGTGPMAYQQGTSSEGDSLLTNFMTQH
jgi:hypothetical protein